VPPRAKTRGRTRRRPKRRHRRRSWGPFGGRPRRSVTALWSQSEGSMAMGPSPRIKPSGSVVLDASRAWNRRCSTLRNLSIPNWYAHMWGLPVWYLRQSCRGKLRDERRRALTLIVRMNFILDGGLDRRTFSFGAMFPEFSRLLRLNNLTLREYVSLPSVNVSWMACYSFEWQRVLNCTLRSFVHLGPLLATA